MIYLIEKGFFLGNCQCLRSITEVMRHSTSGARQHIRITNVFREKEKGKKMEQKETFQAAGAEHGAQLPQQYSSREAAWPAPYLILSGPHAPTQHVTQKGKPSLGPCPSYYFTPATQALHSQVPVLKRVELYSQAICDFL